MLTAPADELQLLRGEIDRIDQAVIDLLVERLHVVGRIAAAKGIAGVSGRQAIRPGREAAILRRLLRHAGRDFPGLTLVRMWRELLAATTRIQAPLTVCVAVDPVDPTLLQVARDHFGALTPLRSLGDPRQALQLLKEAAIDLAVLPLPRPGESWWAALVEPPFDALKIVARLPFAVASQGGLDGGAAAPALVVGALAPEPSGDDLALVAIEALPGLGRGRLIGALAEAGLEPRWLASATVRAGLTCHLVEIVGFVDHAAAPALERATSGLHDVVREVVVLGAYARPLEPGELGWIAPYS